jgi:selenocysteine-specific elongation factor
MIRVVGTAGHVDHGKSTLVQALTGTHPDRLREEREREMTIDLGFAWMTLPDGTEIGFVDVPGHRDFIDNMLAGVGGMDAALLVIAADEGVMPQTREHVAILDLLGVSRVLAVLTKIDLTPDPGWRQLVEDDVRRLLRPTAFAEADVLEVSAKTGEGLDALTDRLAVRLQEVPPRADRGRPRLPIDRVFSMTGFGTVVTGTLLDGALEVGQSVVVLPAGREARIRGLQTHRRKEAVAEPGRRVAVNLTGVEVDQVERGDVLSLPGIYRPTSLIDAQVRVLPDAPVGVRDGQELKLHQGAADLVARARVLGQDEIPPGEQGWVQLVLEQPIVIDTRDRLILRRPTPPATLAGGEVVVAHPARRHRRYDDSVVRTLEEKARGSDEDRLLWALRESSPASTAQLAQATGEKVSSVIPLLETLTVKGEIRRIRAEGIFVDAAYWSSLTGRVRHTLESYHRTHRLRAGMPREELRVRLKLEAKDLGPVLDALQDEGVIQILGSKVALAGFRPELRAEEQTQVDRLKDAFAASPYAPPSVHDCVEAAGAEVWAFLVAEGVFVVVSEDVAFAGEVYERMVREIVHALETGGTVSVASVRDQYGTSRKYALALLEHLDAIGVTVRVGDARRRGPAPIPAGQADAASDR